MLAAAEPPESDQVDRHVALNRPSGDDSTEYAATVFVFNGYDDETVLMHLMEAEVDVKDVAEENGMTVVYGEPQAYNDIKTALDELGVEEFEVAEHAMLAQNEVTLDDEDLEQFEKLIDALEDLEDVSNVFHNVNLGE